MAGAATGDGAAAVADATALTSFASHAAPLSVDASCTPNTSSTAAVSTGVFASITST